MTIYKNHASSLGFFADICSGTQAYAESAMDVASGVLVRAAVSTAEEMSMLPAVVP